MHNVSSPFGVIRKNRLAALGIIAALAGGLLASGQALATPAAASEPAASANTENLEPCSRGEITVQFNYLHEGALKKIQCIDSPKGADMDYESLMEPPAGFQIASDWDGYIRVDPSRIGMYLNDIPVERISYQVDISYVFSGTEIATQSFAALELGAIIDEPQLSIPQGYKLATPFVPHEVTGSARLEVELVRALYDVTVTFTDDGAPVGHQAFADREIDSVIVSADLQIPAGYELSSPFADYFVTGDAQLEVPVTSSKTTPEVAPEKDDEDVPEKDDEGAPKEDPKGAATETPKSELAISGDTGTLSYLALGTALTALGTGATIATRIRRSRNA